VLNRATRAAFIGSPSHSREGLSTTADFQFVARQVQTLLDETRQVRKEVAEIRGLATQTFEFARRVERCQSEMRHDREPIIEMELGGALANRRTMPDGSLGRIDKRSTWSPIGWAGRKAERRARLGEAPDPKGRTASPPGYPYRATVTPPARTASALRG
jgi:hypothetical protein